MFEFFSSQTRPTGTQTRPTGTQDRQTNNSFIFNKLKLYLFTPSISAMFRGDVASILFSCIIILIEHEAGDGFKRDRHISTKVQECL